MSTASTSKGSVYARARDERNLYEPNHEPFQREATITTAPYQGDTIEIVYGRLKVVPK